MILETEDAQVRNLEANLIDTLIRMQSRSHTSDSLVASSLTPPVFLPPSTSQLDEVAPSSPVSP